VRVDAEGAVSDGLLIGSLLNCRHGSSFPREELPNASARRCGVGASGSRWGPDSGRSIGGAPFAADCRFCVSVARGHGGSGGCCAGDFSSALEACRSMGTQGQAIDVVTSCGAQSMYRSASFAAWERRRSDGVAGLASRSGHAAESRQRDDAVQRALLQLAERQRSAIVLVYYQGLSNREAAQVLGVEVDALESLLARGRRTLRKLLMGVEGETAKREIVS